MYVSLFFPVEVIKPAMIASSSAFKSQRKRERTGATVVNRVTLVNATLTNVNFVTTDQFYGSHCHM